MNIIDKKGSWVINAGEFPLPDYDRQTNNPGSELILLQPGEPTKIIISDYLRGQPMLRFMDADPVTGEAIEVPQAAEAPAAVVEDGAVEAAPVSTRKK